MLSRTASAATSVATAAAIAAARASGREAAGGAVHFLNSLAMQPKLGGLGAGFLHSALGKQLLGAAGVSQSTWPGKGFATTSTLLPSGPSWCTVGRRVPERTITHSRLSISKTFMMQSFPHLGPDSRLKLRMQVPKQALAIAMAAAEASLPSVGSTRAARVAAATTATTAASATLSQQHAAAGGQEQPPVNEMTLVTVGEMDVRCNLKQYGCELDKLQQHLLPFFNWRIMFLAKVRGWCAIKMSVKQELCGSCCCRDVVAAALPLLQLLHHVAAGFILCKDYCCRCVFCVLQALLSQGILDTDAVRDVVPAT